MTSPINLATGKCIHTQLVPHLLKLPTKQKNGCSLPFPGPNMWSTRNYFNQIGCSILEGQIGYQAGSTYNVYNSGQIVEEDWRPFYHAHRHQLVHHNNNNDKIHRLLTKNDKWRVIPEKYAVMRLNEILKDNKVKQFTRLWIHNVVVEESHLRVLGDPVVIDPEGGTEWFHISQTNYHDVFKGKTSAV
eukprot:PhF_6_TR37714/c0_g1_i2/m.56148